MRSAFTLAVAVLLVFSLVPMAIATAGTPLAPESPADSSPESSPVTDTAIPQTSLQVDSDETPTRLGLSGAVESAYVKPGPDLGTALAAKDAELRSEWTVQKLEYQWSDLNRSERINHLESAEQRVIGRSAELDERQRTVTRAMAEGEASASRMLRTLALNDYEASVLKGQLDSLDVLAEDVPFYSLMADSTIVALSTHEGPIRDSAYRMYSASNSADSTSVVLLESADSGVVVSTTAAGIYLREADRYDYRDPSLPNQYQNYSAGVERLNELYPWIHEEGGIGRTSIDQYRPIQQFTFDIPHKQGLLTAHLDSGTTEVFRENQRLRLGDLPTASAGTWRAGSTTVSLTVTPRDGPVKFNVTETETDEPVDATILIDDEPIARTGSDGIAWIVRPVAPTEVTVQTPNGSTTIQLSG